MLKKIESKRILSISVAALISLNTFGSVFAENVIIEDVKEPVTIELNDVEDEKEVKVKKEDEINKNEQSKEEVKPEELKEEVKEPEKEEITKEEPPVMLERKIVEKTVLNRFAIEGSSKVNTPHILKAYANSSNGVLFKFFIKDLKTNKWTMVQDYSEKDSAAWVPKKDGSYWYGVHIKDKMSKLDKENHLYAPIEIEPIDPAVLEGLTIDGVLEVKTPQEITAQAQAENGVLYKFFIKDLKTNKWEVIQDYSDKNNVTWIPSVAGDYQYGVHVKDRLSVRDKDSHKYTPIKIAALKPAEIVDFTIVGSGYEKTNHTLTANAAGRNSVLYKFFIKDLKTDKWTLIQDYSQKNTVNWTPKAIGKYEYGVHVKDEFSERDVDNHLYKAFTVNPPVYYNTSNYGDTLSQALAKQVGQNTISKGGKWVKATEAEIKQYLDPNRFLQFTPKASDVRYNEGTVTSDTLNMRSGPSVNYDVVAVTLKGRTHDILDQSGGWYLIELDGVRGWVLGSYLSFKEADKGQANHLISLEIMENGLSVRQSPDNTSTILTTLNSGNVYIVLETRGNWYQINAGGKIGWVSDEYTKLINDVPREMYQFMVLSGQSGVSPAVMNKQLEGMGILEGRGSSFVEASKKYNINELYLMAHAFLETGKGTSKLAKGILVDTVAGKPVEPRIVYNMYGIGAIDSNPIQGGTERAYTEGWFTPELAITEGAHWISNNYINNQAYKQDTLYKMKFNPVKPGTHQYATDIAWASKQTRQIDLMMEVARRTEGVILRFDIPQYR